MVSNYKKPDVPAAVAAYAQLAAQNAISPAQMAMAFIRSRPYVPSTIIGTTTMSQLKQNLDSIELNVEQLKAIEEIHLRYNNPAP